MNEVDLSGQVAVVTGAGRGIGRAIAEGYAAAGASVVLAARTQSEIDEVADGIAGRGGHALAVSTDVADTEQVRRLVDRVTEHFGRLDLVVANAGVGGFGAQEDRVAAFRQVLEVNTVSVFALVDAARALLADGGGKVIVMGSGAGYRPFPGGGAYSTSKAATSMLVRVLATELREDRVAVNEIIPGPVQTQLAGTVFDTDGLPAAIRLDWHKQPGDVVPMALFLAGLPDDGPSGQCFSLLGRDR